MKKIITTIMMALLVGISVPLFSGTASAQRRYYNDDYYNRPSYYQRHRKAINIGVAAGAGAIIGALIGGKKGALIGAGAGVGTGLIINKKQRPRYYYGY